MGGWLYPNLLLLVLAACFGTLEIRDYFREEEPPPIIGEGQIGPWRVTLAGDVTGGVRSIRFLLRLDCGACEMGLRAAEVALPECPGVSSLFRGPPNRRTATVAIPAGCHTPPSIALVLTGWDGVAHRGTWPVPDPVPTRGAKDRQPFEPA